MTQARIIARCSCGKHEWTMLPPGTKSSDFGGMVWHSLECPCCRSGTMAVSNERGLLSEDEARLVVCGKTRSSPKAGVR